MTQTVVALVHWLVAVAVVAVLTGLAIIPSSDGWAALQILLGLGVGGSLALVNPLGEKIP